MIRRLLLLALLGALALASPAAASSRLESTFQDDDLLVYATPPAAARTMDRLKALGVQRLRISVFWRLVAPDPTAATPPAGFDAADPAAYPAGAWDRYDTIVRLAAARGLKLNFDVTSPAPNWATGTPDRTDLDPTYEPDAAAYGRFVAAVATRYSGSYVPGAAAGAPAPAPAPSPVLGVLRQAAALPRVSSWSVWNEPNQPGWLTPQWAPGPTGALVEAAPRLYRGLVDAAYAALTATGHAADTILVGETAPKGAVSKTTPTTAIAPGRFIRRLYCLDDHLQALTGAAATAQGCPTDGAMVADHPGLFRASGWAHHPYELIFAPTVKPKYPDWYTIANLPALESLLERAFQRYGQKPAGGGSAVPLYLTEFGYQTRPPDPTAVSPAAQAAYLNQAEYLAWRNPDVRTLSQFLLVDSPPVPGVPLSDPAAYATFQSGLEYLDGRRKPAFAAYRMPVALPAPRVRAGRRLRVWGGARLAPRTGPARVAIQVRVGAHGSFHTERTVRTRGRTGYLLSSVAVRASGAVRLRYASSSRAFTSRVVPFTVVR